VCAKYASGLSWHADHDGHAHGALVPVGDLGELARDLVERRVDEAVELDLAHGPVAAHRQADGRADDAGLGERGVDDPARAEVALQVLGDAEDAAERADVLAHEQDLVVVLERAAEAGVEGLRHGHALDAGGGAVGAGGPCGRLGAVDGVGHRVPPSEAS
jgi:hypothetical protein